jgi:hypothetical protein
VGHNGLRLLESRRRAEGEAMIQDAAIARIVAVVWPADITAGAWVLSRYHKEVRDVIDGLPVPTVSRAEREQILVEWEKEKKR